MKETEFRSKFHGSVSPDHDKNCYIIEQRSSGFNSKWKKVEVITKSKNIDSPQKALDYYLRTYINIQPTNDDSAYIRIKRL